KSEIGPQSVWPSCWSVRLQEPDPFATGVKESANPRSLFQVTILVMDGESTKEIHVTELLRKRSRLLSELDHVHSQICDLGFDVLLLEGFAALEGLGMRSIIFPRLIHNF